MTPPRDWWIYILAAFPAHVIAEFGVGMPIWQLLVAFATNCLVAVLNAVAMRKLLHGPPWFGSLRKALSTSLRPRWRARHSSHSAAHSFRSLAAGAIENYWTFWLQWYLANALSSLTLGPLAFIALSRELFLISLRSAKTRRASVGHRARNRMHAGVRDQVSTGSSASFIPALVLLPLRSPSGPPFASAQRAPAPRS